MRIGTVMMLLLLGGFSALPPLCAIAQAADGAADIVGFWETQDHDGVVEIYACGEGQYCGRFRWLADDSVEKPSLDDRNPDPLLKSRPLCGMQFMGGFEKDDSGVYQDGWIYSPRHGGRFSAQIKMLDPRTIELHGYVLLPLLGDSQIWRKVEHPANCPQILG